MSVLSPHGLGQFLSGHRQTVLVVLSVLELLILLAVFARWYDRRYGLRRTARRIRRAVADAWRDLVAPIVRSARFRRGAKVIAARLAETGPSAAVREALESARLKTRPDTWPYLLRLGPKTVTVTLAGPDPAPVPEAAPWQPAGDRHWTAARPVYGDRDGDQLPVAVGVAGDDLVLLDLARSPGMISVHGSAGPADRLVSALAAQLTAGLFGAPATLLLHDAVLDSPAARPLRDLTLALEQRPAGRHARTVLVCSRPGESDAALLAALTARDPGLVVLVGGYLPGSRWRLRVTSQGRVLAPELGIDADGGPLWKGLERALAAAPAVAPAHLPGGPIWAQEERAQEERAQAGGAQAGGAQTEGAQQEWAQQDWAREEPIRQEWAREETAPPAEVPPVPPATGTDDLIEPAPADAASSRSSGDR